jgi:hypothetical protein
MKEAGGFPVVDPGKWHEAGTHRAAGSAKAEAIVVFSLK